MRDSLKKIYTDEENAKAAKIAEIVYSFGRGRLVEKAYVARRAGISIKQIEYLMPRVTEIVAKTYIGYTILPIKTRQLLYTNSIKSILRIEFPRIHQWASKCSRTDASLGALKEHNDPTLRAFAYRVQFEVEHLLDMDNVAKEIMINYGVT